MRFNNKFVTSNACEWQSFSAAKCEKRRDYKSDQTSSQTSAPSSKPLGTFKRQKQFS